MRHLTHKTTAAGLGFSLLLLALLCTGSAPAAAQSTARFEFGPEITQFYLNGPGSTAYQPALGGFFSVRIAPHIDFDSAVSVTPKIPSEGNLLNQGHMTQGFFGARSGFSKGRVTFYAKARPGFVSWGDSLLRFVGPGPIYVPQFGRLTEPTLDVGSIVTVRISHRYAVRYEAGDTIIFYRPITWFAGEPPSAAVAVHHFQFAAGFVFRFGGGK